MKKVCLCIMMICLCISYGMTVFADSDLTEISRKINGSPLYANGEIVSYSPKSRTVSTITNGAGLVKSTLTSDNTDDIFVFMIPEGEVRYFSARIQSDNTDYYGYVCVVGDDGSLYPVANLNKSILNATISEGYYAFYITSDSSVGDDYNLHYNMSVNTSENVVKTGTGFVNYYVTSQIDEDGDEYYYINGSPLDYRREHMLEWTSGLYSCYKKRVVNFFLVKPTVPWAGVYSYSSTVATSENAIIIPIAAGSHLTSWYYYHNSNPNVDSVLNKYDAYGNFTPRTLTEEDVGNALIIFDLESNQVVDVYGGLNSFYGYFENDALIDYDRIL